jgi:phosphoribosylanthranilate isomerase
MSAPRLAVKICGLSTAETVAAAVEGGADFIGFVFYRPSPRYVTPERAGALAAAAPAGPRRVGLFVDAEDAEIAAALAAAPLDMLQLHGSESAERVAELRRRFATPVMKVLKVAEERDLATAEPYLGIADWLLFDAKPPRRPEALPGGNGLPFDWRLLAGRRWPIPWMLSGGLTADNLAAAVRLTGVAAVDVSSGVESAPGVKRPERIAAFLEAARAIGSKEP